MVVLTGWLRYARWHHFHIVSKVKQVLFWAKKVATALSNLCNEQHKCIVQQPPTEKEAWPELCERSQDQVNISCTLWGEEAGSNAW